MNSHGMNVPETTEIESRLRRLGDELPDVSRAFKARLAMAASRSVAARKQRSELPGLHLLAVSMVVAGLLGSRAEDVAEGVAPEAIVASVRAGRPEAGNWWTRSVASEPVDPLGGRGLKLDTLPDNTGRGEWGMVDVALLDRNEVSGALTESTPLKHKAGWRDWARLAETV
jgi:hypothetical protein